jgi:hypothetical protein
MYRCNECNSIAATRPNYSRWHSDEVRCDFCGAPELSTAKIQNRPIDIDNINYLFPPITWPNYQDKLIELASRYSTSYGILCTPLLGYSFIGESYPRFRIQGIRRPLPVHNWRFEYKIQHLREHPEDQANCHKLYPIDNVACLINNSFYAFIEQTLLVGFIFNNELSTPKTLFPVANKCIWTLGLERNRIESYNQTYVTFTQEMLYAS